MAVASRRDSVGIREMLEGKMRVGNHPVQRWVGSAVLTALLAGSLATASAAGAAGRAAVADGQWAALFTWAGSAAYRSASVTTDVAYIGNGSGTLLVDGDSVAGPYSIVMAASGGGTAESGTRTASGSTSDTTWTFAGSFGGDTRSPCLTGTLSVDGTFRYTDSLGTVDLPVAATKPMTCDGWPIRLTSVTCNVVEGEWAWLKTAGLTGVGFQFSGAPSRFWAVRTPTSAAASTASNAAMQALSDELAALVTQQPVTLEELQAFLRVARTRLPAVDPACGRRQSRVELAALTRVLIAQLTDQGVTISPAALAELVDFAARVDAFATPLTDLGRTTAQTLQAALTRMIDDPAASAGDLADAADAARRIGWTSLANRLDQAAAAR